MSFPFTSQNDAPQRRDALEGRLKAGVFLVVDDFDSMRKATINQLKQLGVTRVLEARNGAEALKLLEKHPVTMVLSDWNMPVMSGLELLLALRSQDKYFTIPFLMITAEAERDKIMTAIQAGVSELLVKPYTAARFGERVERTMDWLPRLARPAAPGVIRAEVLSAAPPVTGEAREKPTILVVDDTPDNLHLLAQIFKTEYRVKVAHNGETALNICQSDTPPDLVLLDIMMPGMDGFQVAQHLREHPSSEHIPVIFVTAMAGEEARLKGMELGAVDFVTKPIDPGALKLRVQNFMRYIELHRQLQADYDQMMETERLKDDVERITRHDMKGPLSGILGLVQGLASADNLTPTQREEMRMIEETAMQVLDMINLSNELYKIETGRFALNAQPMSVPKIVRQVAELVRRTFAVKNVALNITFAHGASEDNLIAVGDPMLCYSLFQNLLKNAYEATPENSVVGISFHAGQPMRIVIENGGVVPAAIRENFFDKFATAGKAGGTGLGTYSARLLTEAQHGTIAMETDDNIQRTRIILTLPASPAA